jgi:putative membrane protein
MTDILLAIAHHLLVFAIAAALAAELALTWRPGAPGAVRLIAGIDAAYGALASGVIVVGILRVIYGAKGYAFFVHNPVFWAKMVVFAAIGLLSIGPTRQILQWRKQQASHIEFIPPAAEVMAVRRTLMVEAGLFLLLPVLAVLMARGWGLGLL